MCMAKPSLCAMIMQGAVAGNTVLASTKAVEIPNLLE